MTPPRRGVLQMSGVVIDILQKVERLPRPGEEVSALASRIGPGGGFNALAAARRAGADAAYGGMLGTGPFAEIARSALAFEGADIVQTARSGADQGFCVVLVEADGERAYVYNAGAERTASAADLARVPAGDFAWTLLGGFAEPEDGEDVFGDWLAALSRSTRLMFDPTPLAFCVPPERLGAALRRADWISANAREAEAITGEAPARASQVLGRDREGAVVRDGAAGCWISWDGGTAHHIPGFPVDVVDATGAGDAHIGAFVAALMAEKEPAKAARFANAAAALSVKTMGAATAPRLSETLAFLRTADVSREV